MNANFEVVKQARSWLKGQVELRATEGIRTPSPTTARLYEVEAARLFATGDPWTAVGKTEKKSTFFLRRAALLHVCRARVDLLLAEQDKLQRAGLMGSEWLEKIKTLKETVELAEQVPDETPEHLVKRRVTKRVDLWKLPENWREAMIDRLPKYREAACISAISGCRPSELVNGVDVSVANGMLKIRIRGAKTSENSGQEWRELCYSLPSENPLAIMLGRIALLKGGSTVVKIDDAKAFSGAVRAAGKRAFPQFGHTITPYSFRHQVASDLKAADLGDQISQALGHAASDTKGSYGEWGAGNGSMAPDAVNAARPVKIKVPAVAIRSPAPRL